MKAFMDKDFLLETETAKKRFHDYAQMAFHAFLRCGRKVHHR